MGLVGIAGVGFAVAFSMGAFEGGPAPVRTETARVKAAAQTTPASEADSEPIAVVNGVSIPRTEFDRKFKKMTSAFAKCMGGQANVLLLSGPAGAGKSTAYSKLQTWVLSDYARMKKKEAGFLNFNSKKL